MYCYVLYLGENNICLYATMSILSMHHIRIIHVLHLPLDYIWPLYPSDVQAERASPQFW